MGESQPQATAGSPGGGRDVRLIVGAVGISAIGDFLLWVPLTLHLQAMTDSGVAVAALFIALWAPVVVLAPLAGLVVDRVEARMLLLVVSLAQAGVAAGMVLAVDSVAAILVLAAVLGTGFAFAQPAEFSLVPVIAGDRALATVNGYVESARYAGMTAGPALGGVLAGLGGTKPAFLVNAATFGVVALVALVLTARRRPDRLASAEGGNPDRGRDGIVVLFRDRTLGLVVGVVFVSLLFMSASVTAEVFFLKVDLKVTDAVYGLVFAAWTIGMVAGALAIAPRIPGNLHGLVALVAVAVQGFGLGIPTAWLMVWFAAAMWFIGGLGHGTKNVLARTLIQERVPPRLHGRAFAAYNGLRNGSELVALGAGGLMVTALGGRMTLALAGGVSMLAALAGLLLHRRGTGPDSAIEPEPESRDVGLAGAETSTTAP